VHLQSDPRISIRKGTVGDLAEILRQRRCMYEDMNYEDIRALDSMVSLCTTYLEEALSNGSFRSWLAMIENKIVGGGAVLLSAWPAHP
jgi:hypothetical protein